MKFLKNIKDFYNFHREYNIPQSKKYRDISDFLYEYVKNIPNAFSDLTKMKDNLIAILDEIKIESEKEYSEHKYQLADRYKILYSKFERKRNELIEDIVTKYYSKTGENLFDDIEDVLKWLPSSKYRTKDDNDLLVNLNKILSDSDIKKSLDNFNNW